MKLFPSGLPELDSLLGGGLPDGSTTLLTGPAGSGKSSVVTQFMLTAAREKERAAVFLFEETRESYLARAKGMGMDLEEFVRNGAVHLQNVDPAELSPGRFAHLVRRAVEVQKVKILALDSLGGYVHAMPDERFLMLHLHELSAYLNQMGVVTLFVLSQSGTPLDGARSSIDMNYLADNILVFRPFEAFGEVRKSLAVLKKRSGAHERTIRELKLTSSGISIGEVLVEFQGILTGTPMFVGQEEQLLRK